MRPHKEHTVCATSSSALPVIDVARVTPCRYSTRKAIRRYRCIQSQETIEALASQFQAFG
jgi:hypothetical protein